MPDLQSELSKIANAWDDQEKEIRKERRIAIFIFTKVCTFNMFNGCSDE